MKKFAVDWNILCYGTIGVEAECEDEARDLIENSSDPQEMARNCFYDYDVQIEEVKEIKEDR